MELRGEFKSVSEILDLIQIVSMGKKSGEVNFRGREGSVTVYFDQGKGVTFDSGIPTISNIKELVVSGKLELKEAMKRLLHYISFWVEGRFLFVEKSVSKEKLGEVDMVNVMMEFSKETDETPADVKETIREGRRCSLSENIKDRVCFDEKDWLMFVNLVRGKSLRELIFSFPIPYGEIVEKFLSWKNKGIIVEVASESEGGTFEKTEGLEGKSEEKRISQEKIDKIKEILTSAMGPMGEFLVDETFEDLEMEYLTPATVSIFIDALLQKIPETCLVEGQNCRERFKTEFENILKGG